MMSDLKKYLKLIKYGYQIKMNVVSALFFFVLALISLFTGRGFYVCLSASYFLLVPLFGVQISYSLMFSDMVLSSSVRKGLDQVLPNAIGIVSSVFALGMTYVGLLVNPKMRMGTLADSGNMVIAASIVIATVLIYYGASYKFFIGGTAVFFVMFLGVMAGCGILTEGSGTTGLLTGSIIGFLIVVAGNVLGCILRTAVYKYSMDPWAAGGSLRKAMK